jgi:hypothetical protein
MGAGILPVALHHGILYILLGQERYNNNLWSDFGGGAHKNEKPFKTAIREGTEELNGFLGSEDELEKEVTHNMILSMVCAKYTTYIYRTTYNDDLPIYFANNNKFIERCANQLIKDNDNGLYEKITLKWFPITYFQDISNKNMIRPHYLPHVDSIIKNSKFIIEQIRRRTF